MARVLVTGSSDGLGLLAGRWLVERGHRVTWHARTPARAAELRQRLAGATAGRAGAAGPGAVPGSMGAPGSGGAPASVVVVGDLSSLRQVRAVAYQVEALGPHDAAIHNAGVGYTRPAREEGEDGHELHLTVNVVAPYLLTALVPGPRRLVYLSSGMHRGGTPDLSDVEWRRRPWRGAQAYSDSKLLDVVLAMALARRWPSALVNAVEPGWVPTKMGGPGAPDDLQAGGVTQAWLAAGDDPATDVSAGYWYHQRRRDPHPAAHDPDLQDRLLDLCAGLTGVALPPEPPGQGDRPGA